MKVLKFETKTVLIGYFGLEFQKANVVFEISVFKFTNINSAASTNTNTADVKIGAVNIGAM